QNRVENPNPIVGLDNLRIANLSENSIYDLSGLITQMEAHNRQGYVVDRGMNSLIMDQYMISFEEDIVKIEFANPIKNIRNQFVAVDTNTRAEDGMYEGDPIQKAVDAYNQAIESLANQGVSIVSRTEVADNDTLVIRLSSEYFDQEGEEVSVQLPFFEREAISYDSS
ncbi:hypothetical protein, partial [Anoxybacillus flavithermus]|uniref:hypothetical protein n=1 Tax=Anoxybacillus flavithermus TaxID=33934 RepID=UPI001868BB4E